MILPTIMSQFYLLQTSRLLYINELNDLKLNKKEMHKNHQPFTCFHPHLPQHPAHKILPKYVLAFCPESSCINLSPEGNEERLLVHPIATED